MELKVNMGYFVLLKLTQIDLNPPNMSWLTALLLDVMFAYDHIDKCLALIY